MATGASTADLSVVLVDARQGLLTQTRRHSYIISLLGLRHVVLAVNKMDLVDYDQAVFDDIEAGYRQIGRAHVSTPVTNAHLVCRHLLDKNKTIVVDRPIHLDWSRSDHGRHRPDKLP